MLATALWGAWIMAKNGGRRGRIGIPKTQEKVTYNIDNQHFMIIKHFDNKAFARAIAV